MCLNNMKQVLRIFFGGLLSLLLLAVLAGYFFRDQLQKLVLNRLLAKVEATFGQYYQLEYKSLETTLDFSHFSLRLIKPVFTTDTLQRAYFKRYPPVYFKADSLLVTGLKLRSLFLGKDIQLHEIVLANPKLLLLSRDSSRYDSSGRVPQKKRKLINSIRLGSLRIADGDISLLNASQLSDTVYYGEEIDFKLSDAYLPLQNTGNIIRNMRVAQLVFAMDKVIIQPINSTYSFEMQRLQFDLAGDSIHGKDLKLLPERALYSLSKQAEYQKTFAKIALGDIALHGLDYKKLDQNTVNVRKVVLQNARFFLLRNKNIQADPNLLKKSFRQGLAALPMQLNIDSMLLADMQMEFQLYALGKQEPAIIRLTKANGFITNLHNTKDSSRLIQLQLKSNIMAHGKLDFEATFTPGNVAHSFKGHIYTMPFSDWNQVIGQMAPVKIEAGTIDGIQFWGKAGDMESRGTMIFSYHDLKASVWKTDASGQTKKALLLSGAANLILRQNNPEHEKDKPESKPFYFRREPWQGPVMLWVGGLLDGIETTLISEKNKSRLEDAQKKRHKK